MIIWNLYKSVFCNYTKSLDNKTTETSSMGLSYLLRLVIEWRLTRQRHENCLYIYRLQLIFSLHVNPCSALNHLIVFKMNRTPFSYPFLIRLPVLHLHLARSPFIEHNQSKRADRKTTGKSEKQKPALLPKDSFGNKS